MAVLPRLTRTLDDDFTNTWYEIRPEAIDNILEASVLWLALKEHGSLVPQSGGEFITRTVRYAVKQTQDFKKGSTIEQSEYQGKTIGMWDWAYWTVDINRSLVDDQKNKGPFRIKSYVADRIEAARDGAVQDLETKLFRWYNYSDSNTYQFNGIYDVCPPSSALTGAANNSSTYAAGTWGNISRATNDWWRTKYQTAANYALKLTSDWRNFYNDISLNLAAPNFLMTTQTLFEAYEEEIADKQQIIRTSFDQKAADLGFEVLTFKGKPISWSSKVGGTRETLFLNLDWIDVVYDPDVWFDMTEWKEGVNQFERVSFITSAMQIVSPQPRRHGYHIFSS